MTQDPDDRSRIDLLIAALGNSIRTDDGVGIHAAEALRKEVVGGWAPGVEAVSDPGARAGSDRGGADRAHRVVRIAEIGTSPIDALPLLERSRKVLALDAVQAGGKPGSIYRLSLDALQHGGPDTSLHELDLRAAIHLLPEEKRPDVVVLGVEPGCVDFGLELSPAVETVLPEYVDQIRKAVAELL